MIHQTFKETDSWRLWSFVGAATPWQPRQNALLRAWFVPGWALGQCPPVKTCQVELGNFVAWFQALNMGTGSVGGVASRRQSDRDATVKPQNNSKIQSNNHNSFRYSHKTAKLFIFVLTMRGIFYFMNGWAQQLQHRWGSVVDLPYSPITSFGHHRPLPHYCFVDSL